MNGKAVVTIFVILAAIMEVIDSTIANVALPRIQATFGATDNEAAWILTSYIVASAIITPISGWLSSVLGVKKVMLYAVAGFVLASIGCGISMSVEQMIISRILQGAIGCCLIPLSQYVLISINKPEDRGKAMATWGIGIMVAPILGPVIGGYITEHFNWRWIFLINLPIGVLTFFGVKFFMEPLPAKQVKLDIKGFIIFGLFIGALQTILDLGDQKDWFESSEIKFYLLLSILAFFMFIFHCKKVGEGCFIKYKLFFDRNYFLGTFAMFLLGLILFSSIAIVPSFLQKIVGYNTIQAGLLLCPRGFGTLFAMATVGKIINKTDPRKIIIFGIILCFISMYRMSYVNQDVTTFIIVYTGVIQGFGLGLLFVPVSTIAFRSVPEDLQKDATSLNTLVRTVGGSIGIALIVSIISHYTRYNANILTEFVNSVELANNPDIGGIILKNAALLGYLNSFRVVAFMSLAIIPCVLLMSNKK